MNYGIEVLLGKSEWVGKLKGQRVALLGHPASTDQKLKHSMDLLMQHPDVDLTCAFGPQHGMLGDKQYNMEETDTYDDVNSGITVYSLYGEVRRPTKEMMDGFDICLIDMQDVGCRIYTYVATLTYMLEACAEHGKTAWVLDRPNPVGRVMDGTYLEEQWMSFVGEAPCIMQHGLTLGEMAQWYTEKQKLDLNLQVIPMENYNPLDSPMYGWHESLPWVNPSPQLPDLKSCRVYNGTVLLEATHLSEGRGTTVPLQVAGAPGLKVDPLIQHMHENYGQWVSGAILRKSFFVPWFDKHNGQLCEGIQIHVDHPEYDHNSFRPYRLIAGLMKAIKQTQPDFELWRDFHYEYEKDRSPIHLLTGSTFFKDWVDDNASTVDDFNQRMDKDISLWQEEREPYLLY